MDSSLCLDCGSRLRWRVSFRSPEMNIMGDGYNRPCGGRKRPRAVISKCLSVSGDLLRVGRAMYVPPFFSSPALVSFSSLPSFATSFPPRSSCGRSSKQGRQGDTSRITLPKAHPDQPYCLALNKSPCRWACEMSNPAVPIARYRQNGPRSRQLARLSFT